MKEFSDEEIFNEFIGRFGINGFMELKYLMNSNEDYRKQICALEKNSKNK